MTSLAYAMGASGQGGGAQGGADFSFILLMVAMFVIFYFLLIRPQQKKQKELKEMIANLKHGDQVITSSGIYGKITAITDQTITLEIAEKTKIKLARNAVGAVIERSGEPPVTPKAS